ncbi:hypothetical protein SAMN02799630_02131 [Paenibacillus sp. UNCCL117]|uniref:DUF6492 family protein n=1 Tax=unclassified Paenibacillus TaxID=185978 RepID=UPI00088B305A|nr:MULTISPECIES: DUF6492 family protein [unclassified Paenibacillus]SDD11443.1 hypothetical protein SAMN04488602_1067 [Paenibacillus sp. cl123]SFW33572.1 hypothetical protein SAMN02799630_02131 [Paenibacillus sp. UNCCL117]
MAASPQASISSQTKIDVLIPAIEKDMKTLPHVIDAVRKYVRHPIGSILIVAPRKGSLIELCRRKGCRFVDENTVFPLTKKDMNYRSRTWDRSGWLFQQLLKFCGDTLCTADYFLVIDADTVLIRPHTFLSGGKTVFYCRNWSQPEYFRTYRKLLGRKRSASVSFVTHYMLFKRTKLRQLKKTIEAKHGMKWYHAILRSMNKSRQFAFSEFETYGNYLHSASPGQLILKRALNRSLHTGIAKLSAGRVRQLARSYRSISFHERKGYVRKPK